MIRQLLKTLVAMLMITNIAVADERAMAQAGLAAISKGALLVDVRSPSEFAEGSLPGAVNIPHGSVTERIAEFGSDKSRTVVVFCRSGGRAGIAEKTLRELGFTDVVNGGEYESIREIQAAAGKQ
jgi:phage shock protein E